MKKRELMADIGKLNLTTTVGLKKAAQLVKARAKKIAQPTSAALLAHTGVSLLAVNTSRIRLMNSLRKVAADAQRAADQLDAGVLPAKVEASTIRALFAAEFESAVDAQALLDVLLNIMDEAS